MQDLVFSFLFRTIGCQGASLVLVASAILMASLLTSTCIPAPAKQSTIYPQLQVPSDFNSFCSHISQSPVCPPEAASCDSVGQESTKTPSDSTFANPLLAATANETLSCVHFSMVSPSPQAVLQSQSFSTGSPTCPRIETKAGVAPCPTRHLQEEGLLPGEFLPGGFPHASPALRHFHHRNQLQPQYSPYLTLMKSGNAAARRAFKL